jgi:hypothetical protein
VDGFAPIADRGGLKRGRQQSTEAVGKPARAKSAQKYFLYCLSPVAVVSAFILQTDEIENDFLPVA